ncbi:MAG: type II toxin-antitoxin system VapC family toxin [Rhizomicrobium sp.]
MILVDTNVIVDVLSQDPAWEPRSKSALRMAAGTDAIAINDVIYAELAPSYGNVAELDAALDALGIVSVSMPRRALFLAGHAFTAYRRRGGVKTGVLSDFFIGAHAAVERAELLTRDPTHVTRYFPTVAVISP